MYIYIAILSCHIDHVEILRNNQFGFKRQHSTTHVLLAINDKIVAGPNKRSDTIAVSLNFNKAFDTVSQEGIVDKMETTYGFNNFLI